MVYTGYIKIKDWAMVRIVGYGFQAIGLAALNAWRLLCSSILGGTLRSPIRTQVIPKKNNIGVSGILHNQSPGTIYIYIYISYRVYIYTHIHIYICIHVYCK